MRSLAACAHAHYMEGITSIQRGLLQRCNNLKEIAQEQCVCQACELSIKISKDNVELYKLRKTFAVFHLVPLCFSEEEFILVD